LNKPDGFQPIGGINNVSVNRSANKSGETVQAAHDGYAKAFGHIHERTIFLSKDGDTINGTDRFLLDNNQNTAINKENHLVVRFHLHPQIQPQLLDNAISILLQSTNEEQWKFTCIDAPLKLEQSVYFGKTPKKTNQIVLTCDLDGPGEIRWVFQKLKTDNEPGPSKMSTTSSPDKEDLLDILARCDSN
jgi:uncharacterized heparinase superfamily protein